MPNHKVLESFSSHILLPHHQGFWFIVGVYNRKAQILFKKEPLGRTKDSKGDEKKDTKGNLSFWHLQLLQALNTI